MITNWKQEIAVAWLVKQAMMEADKSKLWSYHLPAIAATEAQIQTVEGLLSHKLDDQYRAFLKHANGWPSFVQTIDLFGTTDMVEGPRKENAEFALSSLDDEVMLKSGVTRAELLPIAGTLHHRDLFVITRPHARSPGIVIWFAGEEVERFSNFDDYFLAMVEYNRLDLARLKEQQQGK